MSSVLFISVRTAKANESIISLRRPILRYKQVKI